MNAKCRVLYVLAEFMYGSKVRQVCDLANGLDRSRFEIEICGLDFGDEATNEIAALNVPFYQLRLLPPRDLKARSFGQFLASPWQLRKRRIDIVHSLLYESIFLESAIVKAATPAKYMYTKTNLAWDNHGLNWSLKSRLADVIVSISRATDDVLNRHGFGTKTRKIFLGIDTDQFRFSPDKRVALRNNLNIGTEALVFGCAAQFVEWKEHLTLIDAFDRIAANDHRLHLAFCGPNHSDDYYRTCLKRIETSPCRDRIHLLGTIQDMPSFFSAIDCFVLPSRTEPFGYVFVEAMSCGRPNIGCRAYGPLDIIVENETGLFCNASDPENLAARMKLYLDQPHLLKLHGEAGRKRAIEIFSKQAMVCNHQDLYLELWDSDRRRNA